MIVCLRNFHLTEDTNEVFEINSSFLSNVTDRLFRLAIKRRVNVSYTTSLFIKLNTSLQDYITLQDIIKKPQKPNKVPTTHNEKKKTHTHTHTHTQACPQLQPSKKQGKWHL